MNMNRHDGLRTLALVLVAAAAAVPIGSAHGQYQLGDGRGLDKNLQRGSGGVNAPKLRNSQGLYSDAVVTGNVTGLARFRGDINYPAASEFRGQLGSDDLFDFNRTAYRPSTTVRRLYEGLPSNRALRPGRASGAGGQIILRSGAGSTLGDLSGQYQPYGPDVDVRRHDVGAIQGFRVEQQRMLNPRLDTDHAASYSRHVLAVSRDREGRRLQVETSPLRGLIMRRDERSADRATGVADDILGDAATDDRASDDRTARPGWPPNVDGEASPTERQRLAVRPDAVGSKEQPLTAMQQRRLDLRRSAAQYLEPRQLGLTSRLASGLLEGQRTEPSRIEALDLSQAVDKALTMTPAKADGEAETDKGDAESKDEQPPADPYERLLWEIRKNYALPEADDAPDGGEPSEAGEPAADEKDGQAPGEGDDDRDAGVPMLNRALEKLDYDLPARTSLAGGDDKPLKQAMSTAERHMADGEFFDAADAYTEALVYRPGYPPARIGRAHAYLGAGMFASAARTLRSVLHDHPELIAARYEHPLLPGADRLGNVRKKLQNRAEALGKDTAAPLLLAYLAYQQDRGEDLEKHLSNLNQRGSEDTLAPLLRRIWGGDEQSPPGEASETGKPEK